MSDVIVSQDIDVFMQAADAASALQTLSGLPLTGGIIKGSLSIVNNLTANSVTTPTISTTRITTNSLTANNIYVNGLTTLSSVYATGNISGTTIASNLLQIYGQAQFLTGQIGLNATQLYGSVNSGVEVNLPTSSGTLATSEQLALKAPILNTVLSGNTITNNLSTRSLTANNAYVSDNLVLPRVQISNSSTAINVTSGSISISDGSLMFPTGSISSAAQNIYPDRITIPYLQITDSLYVKNYFENLTPLSSKYAPYTAYTSINTLSGSLPGDYFSYTQGVFTIEDLDGAFTTVNLHNLGVTNTPSFSNINVSNTLTATRVTTNTLSTNEIVTNSLTANEVITNVAPTTVSTNKIFAYPADNSKIFNFNTSSSIISAIFPNSLPNGFNVGITNTGTNSVYISSTQVNNLCATSYKNNTQFSGIYIYKTGNVLYGIGRFN